jgi:Na+-translocating ferredoxin:NAD+ oxidoreductase subunit G
VLRKVKNVSVLFFVGIISAFLLSFVYGKTAPVISKYKEESLKKSLSEVFDEPSVRFEEVKADSLWKVFKDKKYIGIIFISVEKGYSGKIKPIVGVDSTGRIKKVKISKAELSETPGLGMKISEEPFLEQFNNLTADEVFLKKDKEQGKIDAITSATISSRAATKAIREGLEKYEKSLPHYALKEFRKTYLEGLKQSSDSQPQELEPKKLWKVSDKYVFLSEIEDSSEIFHFFTEIEEKKIERISIFVENMENERKETSEKIEAMQKALKEEFEGTLLKNIHKLEFASAIEEIAKKMRNEIRTTYIEQIRWREK